MGEVWFEDGIELPVRSGVGSWKNNRKNFMLSTSGENHKFNNKNALEVLDGYAHLNHGWHL